LSRDIEVRVVAHAGENIEHLAPGWRGIQNTISGQQWQMVLFCEVYQCAQPTFFTANMVPLNFHENVCAAENVDQALEDVSWK